MANMLNRLKETLKRLPELAFNFINIGAVVVIAIGICLLPVHVSYKLIVLGIYTLMAWHAFSK